MKSKTAVAISGGVDSLTAAFLLQQKGHEVIGVHFITGFENNTTPGQLNLNPSSLEALPAYKNIKQIQEQLDIPIHIMDCRKVFQEKVVTYFKDSYAMGETPNPCLVCNPMIKFGALLNYAKKLGAKQLATGHYVKIQQDPNGFVHLLKGDDPQKDQSYFLAFLSQKQLAETCFPLGSYKKSIVKQIAKENGLKPISSKESQDVCFIQGKSYADFLKEQGINSPPGPIVDTQGRMVGEHKGLHLFTIGQRRGINCPAPTPYYVLKLDTNKNKLIVGNKQDLLTSTCTTKNTNWLMEPSSFPIHCKVKIRYQHEAAPATLFAVDKSTVTIKFETDQFSVTPGQGAVFYSENEVLGGGWIA